jgi:hypothetical protein
MIVNGPEVEIERLFREVNRQLERIQLGQPEWKIVRELEVANGYLARIALYYPTPRPTATGIYFEEITMNPTQAGQTQVFTGTLLPSGSVLAPDAVATISSNDPSVSPTLDSTQLIVSVTYPQGFTESATTPLAFTYATTSASTGQALSATITPSAPPPVLATSISFAQTT